MSKFEVLAKPYARALYKISNNEDDLKRWINTLNNILYVIQNKEIKLLLKGNLYNLEKYNIITKILCKYLNKYEKNLIKLIIINKRLLIIKDIINELNKIIKLKNKISNVEITSSKQLNKDQILKIKFFLKNHLSNSVELKFAIDKYLISGIIIRINDYVIEDSIRYRLNKILNIIYN